MHGDKSQSERSNTLESFQAGDCPVLVCTSLLGRGIDLPNVSQVISNTKKASLVHGKLHATLFLLCNEICNKIEGRTLFTFFSAQLEKRIK